MRTVLLTLLLLCLPTLVLAAPLQVAEGTITTAVAHRAPVDLVASVQADVGRLYCFTRITGAGGDTRITHVWYRGAKEMARVTLPVRSADWRTWSSKRILPGWAGAWRVDVLDAGGNLLRSLPFVVQ